MTTQPTPNVRRLIDLHDRDMARVSAALAKVCAERDELRAENRWVWDRLDREMELRCAVEDRIEAVVRGAEDVARRIPSPFADNVVSAVRVAALSGTRPNRLDGSA